MTQLDRQLPHLERAFVANGSLREAMTRARLDRRERRRRRPRSVHSQRKFETVGTDYAVLAVEGLHDVDVDFVRARARRRRQPH